MKRPGIALALAIAATGTAVCMSVLAGWQRGGWFPERLVWIAISVVLVVSAHLLPALVRSAPVTVRIMGTALWGMCMVTACIGHAFFFTFAQQHAGEARAATGMDRPAVSARPLSPVMEERASVARELAQAKVQRCSRNCGGLDVRRVALAAKLDALEAEADDIRRQDAERDRTTALHDALLADPVTSRLSTLLGATTARVDLLVGLVFAAVLEGLACLLWTLALRPQPLPAPVSAVTHAIVAGVVEGHAEEVVSHEVTADSHDRRDDPVTSLPAEKLPGNGEDEIRLLVRDIAAGLLRPTVADIRRHLGCGQSKASSLRRQLANLHHPA